MDACVEIRDGLDCLNHLGMVTCAGDNAASGANHCRLGPDEFIDDDIRQLDGYRTATRPDPLSLPLSSLA